VQDLTQAQEEHAYLRRMKEARAHRRPLTEQEKQAIAAKAECCLYEVDIWWRDGVIAPFSNDSRYDRLANHIEDAVRELGIIG
jgi:hypothetical protein